MIDGHGDDAYKLGHTITSNFSSNVYPSVDLSGLKAHLCAQMDGISSYPEPEPYTLEAGLAERHGVSSQQVCVTNGATEAIYLIAQAFRRSQTAILMPTFSEYADACRMHGHQISSLYSLQEPLDEKIEMLWVCNPNNPTGEVHCKEMLEVYIQQHPRVCFVIDQSYEYFTTKPLFTVFEAAQFPNVLLLHSLTKRYAIPGLRLGYITADESLLAHLRTHRMPWSVNQMAIEAGLYLLRHDVLTGISMDDYLKETARLRDALQASGCIEVWPTDTHYMLACLRFGKASALKAYLVREHGLLIRDASNFEGLDDRFFRVATQTKQENDKLIKAIMQWMSE